MYRLSIMENDLRGASKILKEGGKIVIGRDNRCDLTINDINISRHHCVIYFKDDLLVLQDLNSTNGTYINGMRARETTICLEDKIQLGLIILLIEPWEETGSSTDILFNSELEEVHVIHYKKDLEPTFHSDSFYKAHNYLLLMHCIGKLLHNNAKLQQTLQETLHSVLKKCLIHMQSSRSCMVVSLEKEKISSPIFEMYDEQNNAYSSSPFSVPQPVLDKALNENAGTLSALPKEHEPSILCVPIQGPTLKIFGAIYIDTPIEPPYNRNDLDLMTAIARQLGLALERRQVENQLTEAKETAEAASRAKSEFLATMSHELRTPLNAIIGFSEVLEDKIFGELNEKQNKYVSNIVSSAHHLLSLVNSVLDLTKVESGNLKLEISKFELDDVINSILTVTKPLANKKNININFFNQMAINPINADEIKIGQIIYNLVINAIKFTPEGGDIKISRRISTLNSRNLTFKKESKETTKRYNTCVEVVIEDNGIGIPEEYHARIFDVFEQVDNSLARKEEGVGLGLALARKLVEMHKGHIWVNSQIEQGSIFTFIIPARIEE